jgi:hypothetical protein
LYNSNISCTIATQNLYNYIIRKMKFSGFKKYFLLLMLSFGIVQGSNAFFSISNLATPKTTTNVHSIDSQSVKSNFLFDLVEENIDNDSYDAHFSLDFSIPSYNNITFHELHHETLKSYNSFSPQSLHNQKIHVLNCSFLI